MLVLSCVTAKTFCEDYLLIFQMKNNLSNLSFEVRKALDDTFVFTFFLFCYQYVCQAALPGQACPISPNVLRAAEMKTKMKTKTKTKNEKMEYYN